MNERDIKKYLSDLSAAVTAHLRALDMEMQQPESKERGQRIAKIANALDLANDKVRYFALGVDYRTDNKSVPPAPVGSQGDADGNR